MVDTNDKNKDVVFSFFGGIKYTANSIFKNCNEFVVLSTFLCLFVSMLNFLSGSPIGCIYGEYYTVSYCSSNFIVQFLKLIVFILAFSVFISRWQMIAFQKKQLKDVLSKQFMKQDIKALALILFYFLAFIGISLVAYYLSARVVMDNVAFEVVLYFSLTMIALVFVGLVMISFLWIRFFDEKEWLVYVGKSLWIVFDNIYKLFMWFFVFVLFVLVEVKFIYYMAYLAMDGYLLSIVGEFCSVFILCIMVAIIQGLLNYQNQEIFGDN